MTTTVRLLGNPVVEHDGVVAHGPRGRKGWAVLAHVLLAGRPVARQRLAELLFDRADDPLAALRWTLADLRRALGDRHALRGDPVEPGLGEDVVVDVVGLATAPPASLLEIRGGLLEGLLVAASAEFETWLLVTRHGLDASVEARLRQEAARLLAAGQGEQAVPYAAAAVRRTVLDEGNHVLLVRSLVAAGDLDAARAQVAVCEAVLRDELGTTPSPALHAAARPDPATSDGAPPVDGRAAATAMLEAGRAAVSAGAVDGGVACLRTAVAEARGCGDVAVEAVALLELGGALVHGVRGGDEEGIVVLHEALRVGDAAGELPVAVAARRQLGYVEVQAGRATTATAWLEAAAHEATTDAERAAVDAVRGMHASDLAAYADAVALLTDAAARAGRAGRPRQVAWALGLLGRTHLLRGDLDAASDVLARSLAVVHDERWLAFQPLPQVLQAEVEVALGRDEEAATGLASAWSLACRLGDPCWEALAARGLGRLHAWRGDDVGATAWFDQAVVRCDRVGDTYRWVRGHVLDAAAADALARGDVATAAAHVDALVGLASRCGFPELLVRAHLHAHALGRRGALPAARVLAADIDNPALRALLPVATGPG